MEGTQGLIPRRKHGVQIEAMNAHDMDLWLSYCTDDFVFDYVAAPPPLNKEETKADFELTYLGLPDFHVIPERVLVSGNIVVDEKTFTGTHQGEFLGIPATGNSVQMPVLDIFEYEGNKVKKVTTYLDVVSIMVQLGLMPAGELPPLEPSFTLPDPEPTGLAPLQAQEESMSRWNSGDLALWAKMFRLDADIFYNVLGIPVNRDAGVALQSIYFVGFPDIQGEIVRMVDMGDGWVLTEAVFTGTHDGPYLGVPATGNPMINRVAWLIQVDADGLTTAFHIYFDNFGVLVQIGAIPPPGATAVSPSTWGQIKATFQE